MEGAEDGIEGGVQLALYRILQESLNNAVKHAQATEIKIDLKVSENHGELSIRDNGCGFIPELVSHAGKLGIEGMKGRMREIGGNLCIRSEPGRGTTVSATV
jgi:signal transduction histidine kinase